MEQSVIPKGKRLTAFPGKAKLDQLFKFPMITIYNHPSDYPKGYVARLWADSRATEYFALAGSLDEIRKAIPSGMLQFSRRPEDDKCIEEVWI
jgi:hypothetical protein